MLFFKKELVIFTNVMIICDSIKKQLNLYIKFNLLICMINILQYINYTLLKMSNMKHFLYILIRFQYNIKIAKFFIIVVIFFNNKITFIN